MPGRIDDTVAFRPLRIAVLTVSDTRTAADDRSGDTLAERIRGDGHELVARDIVRDDADLIEQRLRQWIADPGVEIVVTTGGHVPLVPGPLVDGEVGAARPRPRGLPRDG